jgi:hypothetical protein
MLGQATSATVGKTCYRIVLDAEVRDRQECRSRVWHEEDKAQWHRDGNN